MQERRTTHDRGPRTASTASRGNREDQRNDEEDVAEHRNEKRNSHHRRRKAVVRACGFGFKPGRVSRAFRYCSMVASKPAACASKPVESPGKFTCFMFSKNCLRGKTARTFREAHAAAQLPKYTDVWMDVLTYRNPPSRSGIFV